MYSKELSWIAITGKARITEDSPGGLWIGQNRWSTGQWSFWIVMSRACEFASVTICGNRPQSRRLTAIFTHCDPPGQEGLLNERKMVIWLPPVVRRVVHNFNTLPCHRRDFKLSWTAGWWNNFSSPFFHYSSTLHRRGFKLSHSYEFISPGINNCTRWVGYWQWVLLLMTLFGCSSHPTHLLTVFN